MPQANSNPYLTQVAAAAQAVGIDPKWAQATLLTENAPGDPNAVSPQGAVGLMQVLPSSAPNISLSDPTTNIKQGVAMLAANLKATGGDMSKASAMYFAGPSYSQWGPKTHAYTAKVAGNYNALGENSVASTSAQQSSTPDFDSFVAAQTGAANSNTPATSATSATPDFDSFVEQVTKSTPDTAQATPPATAPGDTPQIMSKGAAGRTTNQIAAAQPPIEAALGRIGGAAVDAAGDAFGTAPLGMSPQTTAGLQRAGIIAPASGGGTPLQNLNGLTAHIVAPVVDLGMRGANALISGAQAGVAQAGQEVGQPELGRDLASLPEAFAGDAALMREMPSASDNALVSAAKQDARPIAPPSAPATGAARDVPATNILGAPGVPNIPRSVGAAATPTEMVPMTPEEAASNDAATSLQHLTSAPSPGDATIYVPGSIPTKAEIDANPSTSLEQKQYAQTLDVEGQAAAQKRNNDARIDLYQQLAGNPDSLRIAENDRDEQMQTGQQAAFADKTAADPAPVVETIQNILAGPEGKRPAVQTALGQVASSLYDAKGNLETDPEMLYGVRKAIGDMLSKQGAMANPGAALASSQLMEVKKALDQAIEPGAPGFKQYLNDYAAASAPIDTMQYLQDRMPQVMPNGKMSYPKFNQMMVQIAKQRSAPGMNPAKSIDPETLAQLYNIHSDLKRTTNLDLGRARGSDSVQNAGVLGKISSVVGKGIAHTVAAHVPMGNFLLAGADVAMASRKAAQSQKAIAARANQLLYPPEIYGPGGPSH